MHSSRMATRASFPSILMVMLSLLACDRNGHEIDSTFVDLYVDLKLATIHYAGNHEAAVLARRVLLKRHGMTAKGFHDHYRELTRHPEEWQEFQEKVMQRLEYKKDNPEGEQNGQ